jgi:arylsulfatase A-like enzyme
MNKKITRRDFLKLAGLLPLGVAAPQFLNSLNAQQKQRQNVIVVVFDALSAHNISLYGYQRETMPNLARLAERAVVYHNHYAGGNFTTPGTASLLTGTLPWKHRAFDLFTKTDESFIEKNIFTAFPDHYRLAYTHNTVADTLLTQFDGGMNEHIPLRQLLLTSDEFLYRLFRNDEDTATVSWVRAMKRKEEGFAYSLFLARLYEQQRERITLGLRPHFPGGIPNIAADDYFLLEDAIDWLGGKLGEVPQPFMGYFHFMPPHRPYLTHSEFYGRFDGDGYYPVVKPLDRTFEKDHDTETLLKVRTKYDEFILYVDREIGRFMDRMEAAGLLENTWVVLTSDHGEMFERGIRGHLTSVLYEPVIRIPLLIFEPGRNTRQNIYSNTSATDVLPTLLHVTEQRQANWNEGSILPPFVTLQDSERSVYVLQARKNAKYKPITEATIALLKGQYKLMYFFGYEQLGVGGERIELYDIKNDPEELNDLSLYKRETTAEMLDELKQKLVEANEPYL